jgi:hypothetical protein
LEKIEMAKTISPKQLGELANPDFCPRCFWLHQRMGFKAPFSMFPGIFSTLDKYQKNMVTEHIKAHGKVPEWLNVFGEFTEVVPSPHWSKFSMDLPDGWKFRGATDTLLRKTDGSLFILDEKTAMPKGEGHPLEALYDVQLNGYAKIAEAVGLGPVSGLGIVYNTPQQFGEDITVEKMASDDSYTMKFVPVTREVSIDGDNITILLSRATTIIEMETCPTGNEGCKNCLKIDELVAWTQE